MGANRFWPAACVVLTSCLAVSSPARAEGRAPAAPQADPIQADAPSRDDRLAGRQPWPDVVADQTSKSGTFQIDGTVEGLEIRGPSLASDETILVREVAGLAVTLRATPLDEAGNPVDGGRVIVLRPNETRVVHLAEALPVEDLLGRRLAVETIRGAGRAQVGAAWLTPEEAEAVAARPRVPRRRLTGAPVPPSEALIDQAESSGALDRETAVLYRVYAIFGDARLPAAYRGDDSDVFESLYLSTVVSEWDTYSAATQSALKPFLMPPAYRGSWATTQMEPHTLADVHTLALPPICDGTSISGLWDYKENADGNVRIWYDTAANDAAVAALFATTADTKIWPIYAGFMSPHLPLSDASASCSGGNGRLDIYLTDVARAFTQGHAGCSNTPAFVVMGRGDGTNTLAHEMFHAFQYSFQIGGCMTDANYRWWTEGSATWAEQYIYPFDNLALSQGTRLVDTPEQALDSVRTDIDRVYGTFLVPFYVQNKTGSPNFVRVGWENCKSQDAIHAVDSAIPGGFAQTWHEVALRDWNYKPVDDYAKWRPPITYHANPQANWLLTSMPDYEFPLHMNLAHLSATYKRFEFKGDGVSSVAFFNGATFNLQKQAASPFGPLWDPQSAAADKIKGVKVQAVIKIAGQDATVEDWTDKPYVTFCRDAVAERLETLTIVISNARLDDSGGNAAPTGMDPVLWVSNIGCWRWKGTSHYSASGQVTGSETDDTPDVVWTRTSATVRPPEVHYQATGHINVKAGEQCSGSGTVAITSAASNLTTYNYTPADAAVRRGYAGGSFEFSTIPVTCKGKPGLLMAGPWFNIVTPGPPKPPVLFFSADGKTMTGTYTDPSGGLNWTWNFTAQRE